MALRLQLAETDDDAEANLIGPGRRGALELMEALRKGSVRLTVGEKAACLAAA
jgi:hypothetical protein